MARALERGEAPSGGFHHADHLRVAWAYLEECGTPDAALARLATTLRRFAAAAGQPDKYSDALTGFWIYQLASVRALLPDADVETALRACPRLLDKNLVLAYYSADAPPSRSVDPPRDA
ncbi:MAG TPA: hypothetical protein VKE51_00225 [Vicinamibacterales bacterium]|nr:hypothetical protein [Vicinamibacterales bacterium]